MTIPDELTGVLVNVGNFRGSGAINVVPDFAQSELDVRITRTADREPLLARLHTQAESINTRDGFRLDLTGAFNRPPKECGPAEESAFAAWQQAARDLGQLPPNWVHSRAAQTATSSLPPGSPTSTASARSGIISTATASAW